jgi:serine protease Do
MECALPRKCLEQNEGALKLGLKLEPVAQVAGAGDQGVAIVNVDPNGVAIVNVDPNSAAAGKGLSEGVIILRVSGKPVSQPSEVTSEIAAAKHDGRKAVLMRIKTAQGERFVAFQFPET